MDKFSQEDMEESLAVNVEAKRKKDREFFEKQDPKYAALLKELQEKNADKKTTQKD